MHAKVKSENKKFVIGLDCSTTSVKAIAFDPRGNIVASALSKISLHSPKPNYFEQNADDWWNSTKKVLREITNKIDPSTIAAIAVSNQRETFVALNKKGKSIRPAIIWLDERCKDIVEPFAGRIGKNKIHRISGKPVDYAPVVYRLAWMQKYEVKNYKNIAMICDVQAFINWKLSGEFKTSWSSADPLGIFDLKNKKWSKKILDELNLEVNQLPQLYAPGSRLGFISKEASKVTGLATGTILAAGSGDGQAAGLGAGILSSDCAYLNLGTAVVAGVFENEYIIDRAFRTMCSCSGTGYYLESSLRAGTFAIDWLISNILKIDKNKNPGIYGSLEKEAARISPGSEGLLHLPYLCGVMNPYWDANAKGAFIGLAPVHSRGHLYRSMLEGIAFEILFEISEIEKSIGSKILHFVLVGGGTSNNIWTRILSDVTGRKILLPSTREASALGAAILAAAAACIHRDINSAVLKMSSIKNSIQPDRTACKKYNAIYNRYVNIFRSIKSL